MTRRLALVALAVLPALAACNPTTYDSSAGATDAPATSSTLPSGTLPELLSRMQHEIDGLAALVVSTRGDSESATRIEQYWAVVRPEVAQRFPTLVADFDFVVRLCRSAADRNRPANADRASKNMEALVIAVLR